MMSFLQFSRVPRVMFTIALLMGLFLPISAGAQSAQFQYGNGALWMSGEIDGSTPGRLLNALDRHPDAEWIVLQYVPGSNDDEANVAAARLVRQAGLSTIVMADGLIASGGTDFFLAGVRRIVRPGACIGVHSWSDDDDPTPPAQLPRNHHGHRIFLDYYRDLGIPEQFYWFTIASAPADGMHYMSEAEIMGFGVATAIDGDGIWDLASCHAR